MKTLYWVVGVVIVAGLGWWAINSKAPNSINNSAANQAMISGWKTFTDTQQGLTFKYPETLSTVYITPQTWPPTVKLSSGKPTCTEPQVVNGQSYCVKAQTDGAAGSTYTAYTYSSAMPNVDKTVALSFTLRSVQCANYDEPKKTACDTERTAFNVDSLAYQIIGTVTLQSPAKLSAQLSLPIDNALSRITKKPFGIYITPKTSPVQPEKFTGYHTGTDFETFASEADSVVSVKAAAVGKVIYRKWVSGYGGVMIQSAEINGQPVTILYGHLALDSITVQVGDSLTIGETIGHLGKGYSHDTDGERKHLHLGIHKGGQVVLLGYVTKPGDLSQWLDAATLW
jgi:murein DD-endopeptidase MepM/ murein hydrolase activator NlpD